MVLEKSLNLILTNGQEPCAKGLPGSKINAKQNLVTSSDGSQMVTETDNVACKAAQRRCQKSLLTALTCDYQPALVILAAAPAVNAAVLPRPPCLPRPPRSVQHCRLLSVRRGYD